MSTFFRFWVYFSWSFDMFDVSLDVMFSYRYRAQLLYNHIYKSMSYLVRSIQVIIGFINPMGICTLLLHYFSFKPYEPVVTLGQYLKVHKLLGIMCRYGLKILGYLWAVAISFWQGTSPCHWTRSIVPNIAHKWSFYIEFQW